MRISETAPHLTAAAQASFSNTQTTANANSLDDVLPPSSIIRHYVESGQAFGLFSKNLTVELGVNHVAWHGTSQALYNCATIEMKMPQAAEIKGYESRTFSVYKNVDSGLLYIGDRQSARVKLTEHPMSEREIGLQLLKWSTAFAEKNPSKQWAVISTFSGKALPEPSYVVQVAKNAINDAAALWRRTFA